MTTRCTAHRKLKPAILVLLTAPPLDERTLLDPVLTPVVSSRIRSCLNTYPISGSGTRASPDADLREYSVCIPLANWLGAHSRWLAPTSRAQDNTHDIETDRNRRARQRRKYRYRRRHRPQTRRHGAFVVLAARRRGVRQPDRNLQGRRDLGTDALRPPTVAAAIAESSAHNRGRTPNRTVMLSKSK